MHKICHLKNHTHGKNFIRYAQIFHLCLQVEIFSSWVGVGFEAQIYTSKLGDFAMTML